MIHVISPELVSGKNVVLRLDIDVPIKNGEVVDDFRLQAGLPTLDLCLNYANKTTIIGHVGRPNGVVVESLSVEPIFNYYEQIFGSEVFDSGALALLENLRFESGEEACDLVFAQQLATYGDFYINEAFASHHPAASTTVLPKLLLHAIGLRFAHEIEVLSSVLDSNKSPQIAIIGGAKVEDKYPAIQALAKTCDWVLVGGLLPTQIKQQNLPIDQNVILASLNPAGIDISEDSLNQFKSVVSRAQRIIWAGPLGKYQDPNGNLADLALAQLIIDNNIESIMGGGDTEAALAQFLDKFSFVSVGGGAMLEFLVKQTLPTMDALE